MSLKTLARENKISRKKIKKNPGMFKDQRVHELTARIKCVSKG